MGSLGNFLSQRLCYAKSISPQSIKDSTVRWPLHLKNPLYFYKCFMQRGKMISTICLAIAVIFCGLSFGGAQQIDG